MQHTKLKLQNTSDTPVLPAAEPEPAEIFEALDILKMNLDKHLKHETFIVDVKPNNKLRNYLIWMGIFNSIFLSPIFFGYFNPDIMESCAGVAIKMPLAVGLAAAVAISVTITWYTWIID